MSMICPQCGTAVPTDSPQGVCPRCMIGLGLSSRFGETESSANQPPRRFAALSPADLAPHFPQLEIIELIGQGGMGAVYKARQRGLDRLVALKILPPDAEHDSSFAERFEREARALAKLNHPNVVAVHDSGRMGDLFYFVMEFVDGVNLREALQAGELSPQQALAIVPQICDALQYAHDAGVVHRDIKPENVLLDTQGRVKIADFGLARLLGQADDASLTGTHQVMGTPRYMAPEQLEGAHTVDHRADIYSLGVVFYEMLTGELPLGRFAAPSQKVRIDLRLDEVVLRTLEKEPQRRYQHASDLKSDIQSISAAQGDASQGRGWHRGAAHMGAMQAGYEYRSKTEVFGWPLVHIATGINPATGRRRIAKGIIAIGDTAIGGVAIGGGAVGGVAVGGGAIGGFSLGGGAIGALAIGGGTLGLFSFGGIAIGLLMALGGMAMGLGLSSGGLAVGNLAFGGLAIGTYAFAGEGAAYGIYTWGRDGVHPEARWLYEQMSENLNLLVPSALLLVVLITGLAAILISYLLLMRTNAAGRRTSVPQELKPVPFDTRHHDGGQVGCMIAVIVLMLIAGLGVGIWIYKTASLQRAAMQRERALAQQSRAEAERRKAEAERSAMNAPARAEAAAGDDTMGGMGEYGYPGMSAYGMGTAGGAEGGVDEYGSGATSSMGSGPYPSGSSPAGGYEGEGIAGAMPDSDWIRMTKRGPKLVRSSAYGEQLGTDQIEAINQALDAIYRDYLLLERRSTKRTINELGHLWVTVQLPPKELDELEHRFWTRLDEILPSVRWQELARNNWRLFDIPIVVVGGFHQPPNGSTSSRSSSIFDPMDNGELRIELWRVGRWFHWSVSGATSASGRGPELPDWLERFWAESEAPADAAP